MTVGVGTAVQVGFGIESTVNTRATPDTFLDIIQESLTREQQFIMSNGIGGGRQLHKRKRFGNSIVGGSVSMDMRAQAWADMLRLCIGGDPTPSGAGPYVRAFAGGAALPTATWQVVRQYADGTLQPFDYTGCMVNQWTVTQQPGEYANWQVELFGYRELTDQSAETFAPPASPDEFTFADVTVTTPDAEVCFDSFTLSGNNSLARQFKVCGDGGNAGVRPDGIRTVGGTLSGDFIDMDAYDRYVAGTEGTLTIAYNIDANAILSIAMNVVFTGETPTISGPGQVKQGIPFAVLSGTSDAAAITVTLTNDES